MRILRQRNRPRDFQNLFCYCNSGIALFSQPSYTIQTSNSLIESDNQTTTNLLEINTVLPTDKHTPTDEIKEDETAFKAESIYYHEDADNAKNREGILTSLNSPDSDPGAEVLGVVEDRNQEQFFDSNSHVDNKTVSDIEMFAG